MVARPFVRQRLNLTALGARPFEITGPVNFIRLDAGAPLLVSLDNIDFFPLMPGEKISGLGGLQRFWVRSDIPVSLMPGYTDITITYGMGDCDVPDVRLMSPDGRHPFNFSFLATALGGVFAMTPLVNITGREDGWQPHIKDLLAFNEGVVPLYIKTAFSLVAPIPGLDQPWMTWEVLAGKGLNFSTTHGLRDLDAARGAIPWMWITAGAAWNDVAPPPAGLSLRGSFAIC